MGTFTTDLATLRRRARSGDVVRPAACAAQIQHLRQAVRLELGVCLPRSYASFLAECNGFSVGGFHVLGVDAEIAADTSPLAAAGFAGCLATNRAHERARLTTRLPHRFLVVAANRDHVWGMKEEGSFWQIEALTRREVQRYADGDAMLHALARGEACLERI
ncbi:hypothetical protein [Propioniciclava soli]|uniref:SMI1/KNR4 family protein n=1 Tax=Propioniciclava soli TaxID=2775081 RepID=A0ABZ3C8G9_9ACTN|nr:hypothetical protein [Propioniciclava soli]